jgi:hypothetical protein
MGMNARGLEAQTLVTYSVGEDVEGLFENGKYIYVCIYIQVYIYIYI